jgi:hypothetical protein
MTLLSLDQDDCAVDVPVPVLKNLGYNLSMRIDADVPQGPHPTPENCKRNDPEEGALGCPIEKISNLKEKERILELNVCSPTLITTGIRLLDCAPKTPPPIAFNLHSIALFDVHTDASHAVPPVTSPSLSDPRPTRALPL